MQGDWSLLSHHSLTSRSSNLVLSITFVFHPHPVNNSLVDQMLTNLHLQYITLPQPSGLSKIHNTFREEIPHLEWAPLTLKLAHDLDNPTRGKILGFHPVNPCRVLYLPIKSSPILVNKSVGLPLLHPINPLPEPYLHCTQTKYTMP